jgi:hypothetical protein
MITTTDKTIASVSDSFKDGTHKWGGTLYGVNPYNAAGEYTGRVILGVVARRNDNYVASYGGEDVRYLVNNWTAPDFIEGVRQNNVTEYRTRKQAMAKIAAIAAALVGTTAR